MTALSSGKFFQRDGTWQSGADNDITQITYIIMVGDWVSTDRGECLYHTNEGNQPYIQSLDKVDNFTLDINCLSEVLEIIFAQLQSAMFKWWC